MRNVPALLFGVALAIAPAASEAQSAPPTVTTIVEAETGRITIVDDSLQASDDESGFSSLSALAAQAPTTDISLRPSVTSTRLGFEISQTGLVYLCQNASHQMLDCAVTLTPTPVGLSGGHDHHDDARPIGEFTATSGQTGGTAGFLTSFKAPEVGGVISLGVTLVFPPVPPATTGQTVSFTQTIGIQIPDLQTLPAGNWNPIGAVPGQHTDNHYGTETMNGAVLLLADEYLNVFGQKLSFNDMSLVQGGLFDAYGSNPATIWKPPHASHRFGNDIDVGLTPRAGRAQLMRMIRQFGLRFIPEGRLTHYHFRQR